jgi:hypothetical protein
MRSWPPGDGGAEAAEAELGAERLDHAGADLGQGDRAAEQPRQAGDAAVRDAAGDDRLEVGEVGVDVHGEAVEGDVALDRHPDRHHLLVADPDAGVAGRAGALDAEVGQHPDERRLEAPQEVADAPAHREDRVADELARAVVGDVAAALDVVEREAARTQLVFADPEVLAAPLAPEGDDGVVLDEQQRGRAAAVGDVGVDGALHVPRLAVVQAPEVHDLEVEAPRVSHRRRWGGRDVGHEPHATAGPPPVASRRRRDRRGARSLVLEAIEDPAPVVGQVGVERLVEPEAGDAEARREQGRRPEAARPVRVHHEHAAADEVAEQVAPAQGRRRVAVGHDPPVIDRPHPEAWV